MGSLLNFVSENRDCPSDNRYSIASAVGGFVTEQFQEMLPVSLVVKDRLLIVAAHGEVVERAQVFHAKLMSRECGARWGEVQSQATTPIFCSRQRDDLTG